MELEEAFKILEGDPKLQCKYGNDGDGCINTQIAKDEALLTIRNYIDFETIPKKRIGNMLNNIPKEHEQKNKDYEKLLANKDNMDKLDFERQKMQLETLSIYLYYKNNVLKELLEEK